MSNDKRKVYVVGHKNPDTDSICTAIAYANLKTKLTQIRHEPRRAGQLNEETQYVLERFGVKVPLLLSDLREQIKDVDLILHFLSHLLQYPSLHTAFQLPSAAGSYR